MIRRIVGAILLLGIAWVVVTRHQEISGFFHQLSHGLWYWIVLAAVLQFVQYALRAKLYQESFRIVGIRLKLRQLVPIILGSLAINIIAPTAGLSGFAAIVNGVAKTPEDAPKATVGALLGQMADFVSFAVILAIVFLRLGATHSLSSLEVIAASLLGLIILVLLTLFFLSGWKPAAARWLLGLAEKIINGVASFFVRRPVLNADWIEVTLREFQDSTRAVKANPGLVVNVLVTAFAAHFLQFLVLAAVFLAFAQRLDLTTLLVGYGIGVLFLIISITPQGIGIVEGVLALTLSSYGITAGVAAVIAIVFRGISFWIPFLLGVFTLESVKSVGRHLRTQTANIAQEFHSDKPQD